MVYSEKFFIGFSDVSPDMGVLNSSILKLFENACCLQGEAVGDGFNDTPGRWFLTAYHVIVTERPKYGDWVEVRTWSRGMKGVSASREFEIVKDDKIVVKALSNWARLNSVTGKLERMSDEAFSRYESEPERHNFDSLWLPKLRELPDEVCECSYRVGRNLIDPNRHMNNVCYLDLAVQTLPDEIYADGEPDEFMITYRKAVGYGENIVCVYGEDEKSRTVAFLSEDRSETKAIVCMIK